MEIIPRICFEPGCKKIYGCWTDGKCNECHECDFEKCVIEKLDGTLQDMLMSHGICKPCQTERQRKKLWKER